MIPNPSGSNLFFIRFILWEEKKKKQWIPKGKKLIFLLSRVNYWYYNTLAAKASKRSF